jgi:Flp pilus assembly protein TadD
MNYATLLRGTGRYGEAVDQFAVLVTLLPSNPSVRVALVSFLRAPGGDREACSAQAEAEQLFPADAGVRQMRQQLGG